MIVAMANLKKILAEDEAVVFSAHAHWKRIVWPVLVIVLAIAAVIAVLLTWVADSPDWVRWVVIGLGAVIAAVFGLWRIIDWWFTTDTLTNRRLISRHGVITLQGRDIPVSRVHSVTYRQTVLDRILRCGTIVVQTAGSDSDVELLDVARIEHRMLQIQEIILDTEIPEVGNPKIGATDSESAGSEETGSEPAGA